MLHYLPGCDVKKNHNDAINKIIRYMENKGAIIDQCCRVKKKLLNENDIMINNCTLCELVLSETHQENECKSLYEFVLQDESFPWSDHHRDKITIQDCWRTRDNLKLQNAIRECLIKMNFEIIELEENYNQTKFDGVWLYNNPAQNCLETAPITFKNIQDNYVMLLDEEEQIKKMQDWCKKYETDKVLVYCNGCERGIKIGRGKPVHIVELIAENLNG